METFQAQYDRYRAAVEEYLQSLFLRNCPYNRLQEAMRYSLLAGGKRVRPVLTLAFCEALGGSARRAVPLGGALECVHTYSLIHDDLPCMDDDALRRGRPTNHKVYGEAAAMLAGDGLLTAAFEVAAGAAACLPAPRVVEAIETLSKAAGPAGMVGGQALDLAGEGFALTQPELTQIHDLKTGAMIAAAADLGCIAAGAAVEERHAVRDFALRLGLAFQIRDDMLDVEGDPEAFGKPIGSDAAREKSTFVTLLGLSGCRDEVQRLTDGAVAALSPFAERGFLAELAVKLAQRVK